MKWHIKILLQLTFYEKTGFVEDEEQENMGAAKTVNEVPEETPMTQHQTTTT